MSNDVKLEVCPLCRSRAAQSYRKEGARPHAVCMDCGCNAPLSAWNQRHQPQRDAILEEAAKACEEQQRIFASPKYAAGQPMSSFGERFGAGRCAEAIRALKAAPAPVVEQIADTPGAGLISDKDGLRELGRLYNYVNDDSRQFTRWQMLIAMQHGFSLASEAAPTVSRGDQSLFNDICAKMAEVVAPLPGEGEE